MDRFAVKPVERLQRIDVGGSGRKAKVPQDLQQISVASASKWLDTHITSPMPSGLTLSALGGSSPCTGDTAR
jgi:hypothetical protein